jgi:hypothetical protein
MRKMLMAICAGIICISPAWAEFTDDFEEGNTWMTLSGTVNQSISQNHTSGGMFSLYGFATFSQPAEAVRQETSAMAGETWIVQGWVYPSGGHIEFGWYDHTLSTVATGGGWVLVSDTITFKSGDSFNVDFYVSGTGGNAYLDDVSTKKVLQQTSVPSKLWEELE